MAAEPARTIPIEVDAGVSVLARWAYITLGEPPQIEDGSLPVAEFAILRKAMSPTLSMTEWIGDVSSEERTKRLASSSAQLKFVAHAVRVLLKRRKDLKGVYISEEFPGLYLVAALCIVLRKLPLVLLVHNVGSKKRRIALRIPPLRNRIDRLLCLSETARSQLTDDLMVRPDRLVVTGSRVDDVFYRPNDSGSDRFDPKNVDGTEALVVSAGAVNRDYETLVTACERLGVRCYIAAGSSWAHTLGKTTFDLSGERLTVESAGPVALRSKYWDATVVVVPLHESTGASGQTVILEAMACGKPVVTSNIRGRSDFIEDGVNGFYVPPGDPDALAALLRSLFDDPERCAQVGARARRTVEEKYSVRSYVARIEAACLTVSK